MGWDGDEDGDDDGDGDGYGYGDWAEDGDETAAGAKHKSMPKASIGKSAVQ